MILTGHLVWDAHIPRCPATEATGQVEDLLGRSLGSRGLVSAGHWDAGGSSGECVATAWTVKAVGTSETRSDIVNFTRGSFQVR